MLTLFARGGRSTGMVEVRGDQVVVRVQRRVRMGNEGQIRSALYTVLILKSHDCLLVFIWSPTFPLSFFLGLSAAARLCRSILEHSSIRVKG